MRSIDQPKNRRVVAVARAGSADRQFIDIVILSLAGLSFAVLEIAQYAAHTGMLRAMFFQ